MRFDDLEIIDLNDGEDVSAVQVDAFSQVDLERKDKRSYKKKQKKDDEDDEIDWIQELKSIICTIVVTVVIVFLLKTYIIINASVPTGSMENTIMPGDNILGLRVAYLLEEPERGDVIFFYFPDDETQKYVKRIIGLPGEKVYINEGKVYINDSETPLEEPYLKEEWIVSTGPYEFYVPEDCYLMLGDNRNGSADARLWKNPYVAKEKIIGKAIFTYYPFDRWGLVE